MASGKPKPDSTEDASKSFYKDLKAFRASYPMCYIEAWTPEDFDLDKDGEPKDDTDWKSRLWTRIASRLSHEFDASVGTNWARVGEITKRLTASGR